MVKISKNAKKILALTLAGVMTVGTVVPGSALSTVENVQAAAADYNLTTESTSAEVLAAVEKEYTKISVKYAGGLLVEGETFDPTSAIEAEIEKNLELDKIGATLEIVDITKESGTNIVSGFKFKVTKSGVAISQNGQSTAVDYYTVDEAVKEVFNIDTTTGKIDIGKAVEIGNLTEGSSTTAIKDAVAKYVSNCLNESVFKDKLDAVVTVSDGFNQGKTRATITFNSKADKSKTASFTGDLQVETTNLDQEAVDTIKSELTTVKAKSLEQTVANAKTVAATVQSQADEILDKYTKYDGKNASFTNASWVSEGVLQGVLTVDAVSEKITINVVLEDESTSQIVKLELVDPKSEVKVTDNATLKSLVKIKATYQDGHKEELTGDQLDTLNYDAAAFDGKKVGIYTVVFTATSNASVSYTVSVYNTKENVLVGEFSNNMLKNYSEVDTISSSNDKVAKLDITRDNKKNITGVSIKTIEAGTANITLVSKTGQTFTTKVTVKEDGIISLGTAVESQTARYYVNNPTTLGFTATKAEVTSQSNVSWEDEGSSVVIPQITTVGDTNVVQFTPGVNGKAIVTLYGGDKEQLTATVTVEVKDGKIIYLGKASNHNFDEFKLDRNTEKKLRSLVYTDKTTLKDLGLSSGDKIVLLKEGEEVDQVSATELTGASVSGTNLTLSFGNKKCVLENITKYSPETSVANNTVEELGIVADTVSNIKNTTPGTANSEIVIPKLVTIDGEKVLVVSAGKDAKEGDTATITLKDSKTGLTADVLVTVDGDLKVQNVSVNKATDYSGYNGITGDKKIYTIGDKINLSDVYLTKENAKNIAVTEEMVQSGFSTNKSEVNDKDNSLKPKTVKVKYAGSEEITYTYYVKPATETISTDALNLSSGEKIVSVATSGDSSISAKLDENKNTIKIVATETNKTGALIVTTSKGKVAVKISVDENGNIATDVTKNFTSSMAMISNTVETLGMTGTEVSTSNDSVAIANITNDYVVITSVAPGTAVLTVKDGDKTATINVTVDEFGTITTEVVKYQKYTPGWHAAENGGWFWVEEDGTIKENGWVDDNGVRYYIENGVTVYNTWKFFESEGVWRYFNKWGANVENGWYWVGKFCYFFRDGQMVENEWIKTNGIWSYVDKYGHALQNGWFKIDGYYYCFDKYGNMYADTYVGKYYVNKWGAWDSRYDKK